MLYTIYFALLINLGARTYAFRFTVLAEYVLETHQRLKNYLDFYIKEEEKRLAVLKIYSDIFEREHGKAMEDIPSYVGNPINAFALIKRLTSDVHYIKTHIKNGAEYAQNLTRYHDGKYPSLMDLTKAAEVIAGFHHTTDLDVKQLVDQNSHYSSSMTAGDCYALGDNLLNIKKDFVNGIAWMSAALRKYDEESRTLSHPFEPIHVYEKISHGYYELGDLESSLHWLQNILKLDPNNSEAKRKVQDYQTMIDYETMTMNNCFHVFNRADDSKHKSCNFICSGRSFQNNQQCPVRDFAENFKNYSRPVTEKKRKLIINK